MMATTRSRVVELSEHTPAQIITFFVLAALSAVFILQCIAIPSMDSFFSTFLRSDVLRDGEHVAWRIAENRPVDTVITSPITTWALVDMETSARLTPNGLELARAEYIFKPLVALAPLVLVGAMVLGALITVVLPRTVGYVRQKIERELLNALDRLAWSQYGEHTPEEIRALTRDIASADLRRLHDLADVYGMPYTDLELLQRGLRWRDASGIAHILRLHDAVKFYMRDYFTDRYANAVLGMVYIGAAILIIVIGIRGLKFLPASDPSVVLGALGLEFMLLITYAVVLMYGRSEDSTPPLSAPSGLTDGAGDGNDADTEQLLRAFLATSRTDGDPERKP